MANVQPTQAFYSLTLVGSSATTCAILCNVRPGLSANNQQVCEARGSRLYLRYVEENEDRTEAFITTFLEQDTFSTIRGLAAVRVPGSPHDYIVVTSDSGRVAMLEYEDKENRFKQVHLETFGKSGVRRTIPGQYLASDPKGRCIMIASTEKNKIVYMFQRLTNETITISSPHEANTWNTITFDLCALNVGWEHPAFAVLEVDYTEAEADDTLTAYQNRDKNLAFYTVDLGLNHVVRTWSEPVDYTANKLFAVPGGADGPSGVIVCAKGRIYYRHEKFPGMSVAIPRREGPLEDSGRDRIIVSGCMLHHRKRREYFLLLQTDDGDVFKVMIEHEDDQEWVPVMMTIRYYETLPLATAILTIAKGYIYLGAEHGDTKLYHLDDLAEGSEIEPFNFHTSEGVASDHTESIKPTTCRHRGLRFISDLASLPALHPLIRTKVDNILNEEAPQILGLQGTGNKSLFKLIKNGISVIEDASIEQGNVPFDNIWSISSDREDNLTRTLVISSKYADRTMVLQVNGDDISGHDDTLFMTNRATVLAQLMGSSTQVQVHARGILSIHGSGKTTEWPAPAHRTIKCAAANERQLLLGLSSAELVFFFMQEDGVLSSLEDTPEMPGIILSMGMSPTPRGRLQSKFAVVGCEDSSVRVISIELDTPLEIRSVQAVSAKPVSIVVSEMPDPDSGVDVTVVHIGLEDGKYLRAIVDEVTGELSQARVRYIGHKPVRIFSCEVEGQQCVVLCSSQVWIGYHHPVTRTYTVTPLVTPWLECVAPFLSEHSVGLVGCANTELRFFRPEALGQRFVTEEIKLQYTPRNMERHPSKGLVYVIESDGNTMSAATAEHVAKSRSDITPYADDAPLTNPKAPTHWASCIQILDPVEEKRVIETYHLDDNEAALCCAVISFEEKNWESFLMVGTGRDMHTGLEHQPGRGGGFVRTYKIHDEGKRLEFLHKTEFPRPIYALAGFKGKMVMGIGSEVFVYDLGMAHVLRKTRGVGTPNTIISLQTMGNRIVAGDVSESVTYIVYNEDFNRLVPFVDDSVARWTTSAAMLDYDTTAGGDKFGNLWVVRCPETVSKESDDQGLNGYIMNERPYMGGTPYRLESRAHFYCQDIPMNVQRAMLVPGGQDILFWSGLQGTLGMLVPFVSRRDVAFFTQLELQMRQEDASLTGRDHLSYRSYYSPVRAVIDGDLCERFLQLHYDKKQKIAAEVDREINDIEKKIQEMRSRVSY